MRKEELHPGKNYKYRYNGNPKLCWLILNTVEMSPHKHKTLSLKRSSQMLIRPYKENWDRGLGGYVIDMCISIADDFFQQEKKELKWGTWVGILRKER